MSRRSTKIILYVSCPTQIIRSIVSNKKKPVFDRLVTAFTFFFSLSVFAAGPTKSVTPASNAKANIAKKPNLDTSNNLSLQDAIDRALRGNRAYQGALLDSENAELSYKNAWDQMFLPGISFTVSSTSTKTLGQLPNYERNDNLYSHGFPATTASFSLGSYTLFNAWKDYLNYQLASASYDRAQEQIQETAVDLRSQITQAYFRSKSDFEKLEIGRTSIEFSQAIYQSIKARFRIKEASEADLNSSEVDLLNAKTAIEALERTSKENLAALNILLGEDVEKAYKFTSDLVFKPVRLTTEAVVKQAQVTAPAIKSSRLSIKQNEVNYELAQKSRLPLPIVTLSGLTFSYSNGYYGTTNSSTTGASGSPNNIDISAQISLTIPLVGSGGFFGSRNVRQAEISLEKGKIDFEKAEIDLKLNVVKLLAQIKQSEQEIENLRRSYELSRSLFENTFAKLKSASRLEIRDVVKQVRESQLSLKDAILNHHIQKIDLARTLGVSDLEGIPAIK